MSTYSPLDPGFPIQSLRELVAEQGWKAVRSKTGFTYIKCRGIVIVIRKTERAALRAALTNFGPFYSTRS